MSKIWRSKLALSLCLLALGSGCGDDPAPGQVVNGDGDGDKGDGDNGDGDKGDGDGDVGDGDVGDGDVGDGDGDAAPATNLGMIEGQYWMRTDLKAMVTQPDVNAIINSDLTAYSVVKITKDGDNYKMVDWQCQVSTAQTCSAPCTMASSTTSEGQAFAPSVRTITVSGSKWEASACAAAVGWKYDFAAKGDRDLPTSKTDPLIYNPGAGSDGVDIEVSVTAKVLGVDVPYECEANTLQKVDVLYSGSLSNGKLQRTGVAKDNGSNQFVFDGSCGEVPDPVAVGTGSMRLLRKDIAGGAGEPSTWTCPSLADFQK